MIKLKISDYYTIYGKSYNVRTKYTWNVNYEHNNLFIPEEFNQLSRVGSVIFDIDEEILSIKEPGFAMDDHAYVEFKCKSFKEAEELMNKFIIIKTI